MNIKQAIFALFMGASCIAGCLMFVAYTKYGLALPVVVGYAVLFSILMVVSVFADKIKRWMK